MTDNYKPEPNEENIEDLTFEVDVEEEPSIEEKEKCADTISTDEADNDTNGRSIGGWLVLPLIGLVLTLFKIGNILINVFYPLFKNNALKLFTNSASQFYNPAMATVIWFEVIINSVFFAFCIINIVFFLMRKKLLPRLMVAYYLSNLFFVTIDMLLLKFLLIENVEGDMIMQLVQILIPVFIWVPYFLRSTRVKETFVK